MDINSSHFFWLAWVPPNLSWSDIRQHADLQRTLSWSDIRQHADLQRTLDKDCRQAGKPKQLVDEASQFHLGRLHQAATDKLVKKIVKHDSGPIQSDILNSPFLRLTSRKLLWLHLQPADIKSRWRHNWELTQVFSSHLMCDPTIRQPGFDLPRQQWSLLNRFCTEQGHCGACRRKWRLTETDLCPCGEIQTMFHIVESCLLTKLHGGLSRLHSADEDAVSWLTNYGSWHAYKKKNPSSNLPVFSAGTALILAAQLSHIRVQQQQHLFINVQSRKQKRCL